jgi:hypothetical protein
MQLNLIRCSESGVGGGGGGRELAGEAVYVFLPLEGNWMLRIVFFCSKLFLEMEVLCKPLFLRLDSLNGWRVKLAGDAV